jgi:hypothetical protein
MISTQKAMRDSKPLVQLMIKNVHLLNNHFIPFFSEENFLTKKGKDFCDFKIICNAIYIGAHLNEEIRLLILKLSLTMNNFRLSTHLGSVESLSQKERDLLIHATPLIEHLNDGRQRNIVTHKLLHSHSRSCVYEIIKPEGEVLILPNLSETAKIVGIGFNTLKRRLDSEGLDRLELKGHKIKRIAVFYGQLHNK